MVKPQSSKLITRVRFPSSPRGLGSRRFRVEALFFFPRGDDGNPFRMRICFLARSESARSSSSSPPQIPLKVAGNRFRAKIHSLALSGFSPSSSSSPENYSEQIVRTASTCGLVSSRARSPREDSRGLLAFLFSTADFSEPAFPTPGSRGTSRACVRRFLPCGWWCRIAGTPRPGACTRSSRARARPQFREYRGGPRARW